MENLDRALIGRYDGANVFIEPITKKVSDELAKDAVSFKNCKGKTVLRSQILADGQLDFTNETDIEGIKKAHITSEDMWTNSVVDLEHGTINDKYYTTMDNIKLVMRGYVRIGKPKEIVIYRENVSTNKYSRINIR